MIVWLPAFFIYTIVPSFQYETGTDYSTYYNYFFNNDHYSYIERNELLYYYLVEFVKLIGDPQFQFILISLIQGFLFFYILFLLKIIGFKSWLVFLIFFLSTGMYNNQMNLLRQYICIYFFIINFILIYKSSYMAVGFNSILSFLMHASSIIPNTLLVFINYFRIKNKKILLYVFLTSFFFWSVDYSSIISDFLNAYNFRYSLYLETEYSEGRAVDGILTKFYFLPIIVIFWYFYIKDKNVDNFFSFAILIFSLTHFMFLQALSFDLLMRVWDYFIFFIIFPIYYVLNRSRGFTLILILIYILLFYVLKVVFFPVAEYDYDFYMGWF